MSQATIKIPPLTKENYDTWKIHVKTLLVKNDAWAYVSGRKTRPAAGPEAAVWQDADEKAMADITLAISADQLKHINGCQTSAEMWTKLKELYESEGPTRKAMLLEELIHHKMSESDDMRDYVSRFFDTVNKLEAMNIKVPQEMVVILLLSSVPKSFDSFRVAIKSRRELPSPEELKVKLFDEYQARKRVSEDEKSEALLASRQKQKQKQQQKPIQGNRTENNKVKCYNCEKLGHIAKFCRLKRSTTKTENSKKAEVALNTTTEITDGAWIPAHHHTCALIRKNLKT